MGVLGCDNSYQVIVIEENFNLNAITGQAQFGRPLGDLDGWTQIVWDRRLDDTSVATVEISTNSECCSSGFLNDLHSWHHGIAIFRNGELVWDGPIVIIEAERTKVTITAHDVSALLNKRVLPRDLCFSGDPLVCTGGTGGAVFGPQPPETVAATLIEEALTIDGHGAFVEIESTSTASYEASFKQYGGPVLLLLQKLASEYINWTVLGRRIVIAVGGLRTGDGLARTALLTCQDFVNDNFKTTEDGLAALTQDFQIADAVVAGGTEQAGQNIGAAQIFPIGTVADPYYGLLQGVQDGNKNIAIGTDPLASLSAAALNIVQGAYPPPVSLSADSMQLAATAPVAIAELVPGTIIPVFADCLCRPVAQEFVLSKVVVTVTPTGESVVPSFISRGADNATTEQE